MSEMITLSSDKGLENRLIQIEDNIISCTHKIDMLMKEHCDVSDELERRKGGEHE